MLSTILYATHTLLEGAAFFLIFPKAAYPTESEAEKKAIPYPGARERKRTHALGLGALALLGGQIVYRGLQDDPVVGLIASSTLLFFHAGCSLLDVVADKPRYFVHYPFALGFAAHFLSFFA